MRQMARIWENLLSVFKYILGGFMMVAGVATMFIPVDHTSQLGFIYESRLALVFFGLIFFVSGAMLLYGKIRRSKRWTGRGLLAISLCFLFGAILNTLAFGPDPSAWLSNMVAFLATALLWLRWRMKTAYIDPKHFVRDIEDLS